MTHALKPKRTSALLACVNVFYVAQEASVLTGDTDPNAPSDKVLIATVTEDMLRTYPIHVRRQMADYLKPNTAH
jgi:hypothetical protein